ncbi:MAG: ABC transporter permease [Melioribacteraceae bacterium]|nr:ABC transporter permease [Melioribacteraceae bacterium]
MRQLKFFLKKEFQQILRNKLLVRLIVAVPIVQLIILPFAANYEIQNIKLCVIDNDKSEYSRKLINKFTSTNYFILTGYFSSQKEALHYLEKDKADLIIEIPKSFENDLIRESETKVFINANAINGQTAGLAVSYSNAIIRDFNNDVRIEWIQPMRINSIPTIEISSTNWFNPKMNYKYFIVPGLMVLLVTLVGFLLTTINIVKEKEDGTIEQLNVSPLKKHQFILGKLIPFWIIGLVVLTIAQIVSFILYGIVPAGSYLTIYLFAAIYLVALLGFGLFVSTLAETQQQAMFIAYFFMMIFILLGGLFAPIENMPDWAQFLTRLNPVSYFIEAIRMIILKGSGINELSKHFGIIILFALIFNTLAIYSYHKTK